jgi:acetyltransferase
MDKHYLTSLLAPQSIAVFAGRSDDPASQTAHASVLHAALRAQRYAGTLHFLDIHTSGTLADLAQSRADLAIIALPPQDVPAALELAGRMACRSALVVGSGMGAAQAADLRRIARREGINLLGPNSLGFQRPQLQLNASAIGPLARAGPLALVSQSGALTASMLDWAAANAVGFSLVASLGRGTAVDIAQVLDFLAHDARASPTRGAS